MAPRRPMGSLESEVLEQLWGSAEALTPAQVQEALGADLAYTTVMTILTRLWKKGLVQRRRSGRAYAYTPVLGEADYLAERMQDELKRTPDRQAVLSRFVDALSDSDAAALRRVLVDLEDR